MFVILGFVVVLGAVVVVGPGQPVWAGLVLAMPLFPSHS
jgi:NADH:ubiquinone oxidoreductase subunit 6 (subunit J)